MKNARMAGITVDVPDSVVESVLVMQAIHSGRRDLRTFEEVSEAILESQRLQNHVSEAMSAIILNELWKRSKNA